jgi:hypothetical protein
MDNFTCAGMLIRTAIVDIFFVVVLFFDPTGRELANRRVTPGNPKHFESCHELWDGLRVCGYPNARTTENIHQL